MDNTNEVIKKYMTRKLYYEDPLLGSCSATVEAVGHEGIKLDQTVAFPEGGGQKGDGGTLVVARTGQRITFTDTQKGPGRLLLIKDFPSIQIENPIYHVIYETELAKFRVGDEVQVFLDINRRAKLTISHTASHLLFIGVGEVKAEALDNVKGCSITEDYARFDFGVSMRFTPEELLQIQEIANTYVNRNLPVRLYSHADEPEAWYWECNGKVIPCGGTHLKETGNVGPLQVKRKNLGKGLERISVTFSNPEIDTTIYRNH